MTDRPDIDRLAPIPEIVFCHDAIHRVLPQSDPSNPDDPSVNLATLAAIAHAKWRLAEAAEARVAELEAALLVLKYHRDTPEQSRKFIAGTLAGDGGGA